MYILTDDVKHMRIHADDGGFSLLAPYLLFILFEWDVNNIQESHLGLSKSF